MALAALKADSEAAQATAVAAPPAADEGGAPPNAALSLACIGCFRLPQTWATSERSTPSATCAAMKSCRRRTCAAMTARRTQAPGSCTGRFTRS